MLELYSSSLLVKPQRYLFNSLPASVEKVTEEKIHRLFKMTQLLFSDDF